MKEFVIAGERINPGEEKQINAQIFKLPTRTGIDIPIIVSRSQEDGPVVLFLAGIHGDEVNGVEIVRRLIVKKHHQPKKGTVICIPIVNIYGFIHASREVPDGKDINRAFPGSKSGSMASQLAYFIRTEIIPKVDLVIDFHTGGARINNFPQIRTAYSSADSLALAKIFATRFLIDSPFRERSLRREAARLAIPFLLYEGGESSRLQKQVIDEGVNGSLRVLHHLGMLTEKSVPKFETVLIEDSTWIRARSSGIYHAAVRVGANIKKGEVLGLITGPFGEFEVPIKGSRNGYAIAVNNNPVVNRGDALIHIGFEKKVT
ncbi:MAG: succinylglutamate desuccinylase/aspartoacylase family protein [Cyclobacteriaceae bacterium]